MRDLLIILVTFASTFLLISGLVSTYHFLPKRNFSHLMMRATINYSERLRTGTKFAKIGFWVAPAFIFLFINFWAGLLWLVANVVMTMFSNRYVLAQRNTETVAG